MLETFCLSVLGSGGVAGIFFALIRHYIERRLMEVEAREQERIKYKIEQRKADEEITHATGRVLFWLHHAIVKGEHNGELEEAFENLQRAEEHKKEMDREVELLNFLKQIPFPVLLVAVLILLVVTLVIAFQYAKHKGLEGIREQVYQLILKAEHMYKESGTGQQKLKWVVQQARGLLPKWLQVIMSEDALLNIIDVWFCGVKDLLDDGKINGSQKEGA